MKEKKWRKAISTIILWLILVIILIPAVWLVFSSFRLRSEINAKPPIWIPSKVTLEGYRSLFGTSLEEESVPFAFYFKNSIIISSISTIIVLLVGTIAAYAFARFRLPGKNFMFFSIILLRAVPGIALGIPLFMLYSRLGLVDTYKGMIITYIAIGIPFATWLMEGFFRGIPSSLDEAAYIDGCSYLQSFLFVDLPLALPGLIATAIFIFLWFWNEFPIALTLTRSLAAKTLPVGLYDFTAEFIVDWRGMCAMGTIMLIPAIVFTIFTQRHMVIGLTSGAIKE